MAIILQVNEKSFDLKEGTLPSLSLSTVVLSIQVNEKSFDLKEGI